MKFQQNYSQSQKQTQKLAMTQKLQQAIQILQFNTEELHQFVETIALENPLFEVRSPKIKSDLAMSHSAGERKDQLISQIPDQRISLFEYLISQIHLNYRETFLRQIILFLVEYIDSNGYLRIEPELVSKKFGADSLQFLDAVTLLQQLDPAGVGARDLQECLMLQTERDYHAPALAYLVLEEAFDDFVHHRWEKISQTYQLSLKEVQTIIDYVRSLDPFPGAAFSEKTAELIIPDLTLLRDGEKLRVRSNKRGQLKLNFHEAYFARLEKQADDETKDYLKEKRQQFQWLHKTILQRQDTILTIGSLIVAHQEKFFLEKRGALKPLTLKKIAEEAQLHESTVSRAVNGKYIETDFGTFELRHFFVNQVSEGEVSADEIKQLIAQLIEQENKQKPLSDQKIADDLHRAGHKVSRRTVAKYREALGIASSSKRKRLA